MPRTPQTPHTRSTPEARLYARVMSQWAMDLLHLRRAGLLTPGARDACPDHAPPTLAFPGLPAARALPAREQALLHWRPRRTAA